MSISTINNSQPIQQKNSTVARKTSALAGATASAYVALKVLDGEMEPLEIYNRANYDYDQLAKQVKEIVPFKDFLKKSKQIARAEFACGISMIMLGALTVGFVVDKCIDAVKSHKAKKAAQSAE